MQRTWSGSVPMLAVIMVSLLVVAVVAFGCGGMLTSSQTSPPTSQTTLPDDNTYGDRIQAWLDKYAANLEKAYKEQSDAMEGNAWKGTPEQLASAKAAADLAHEAFNSLRVILPPIHWADAQYAYLEAMDGVISHLDELASGKAFGAAWGWPKEQVLVDARQTFMSNVLGSQYWSQ
jgi:hypothetical protein